MAEEKNCSTCTFVTVPWSTVCETCNAGTYYLNWKSRFDEERIDVIGPNGNEGADELGKITWLGEGVLPGKRPAPLPKATETQVGGEHYKKFAIQPAEFSERNGLSFLEGCVVKRICRWKDKNGLEDLLKAKHEIDLLIEIHGLK